MIRNQSISPVVIYVVQLLALSILNISCAKKNTGKDEISKFLRELEFGSITIAANRYLIKEPPVAWSDYAYDLMRTKPEDQSYKQWKDQLYEKWKEQYGREMAEYGDLEEEKSARNYSITTYEQFMDLYKNYSFSEFEIKDESYSSKDRLHFAGYVSVKNTASLEEYLTGGSAGRKKFHVVAEDGSRGWKITFFVVEP